MTKASHFISRRTITPIAPHLEPKTPTLIYLTSKVKASSKKNVFPLITQQSSKRLITISTSDGKWQGKWTSDYIFSLKELQLADLAEDGQKDSEVSISLTVEKHASFGFSVDGRIITSFTQKCSNCSSSYCREINTTFDVWLLPSRRSNRTIELPEIGGDDPSVIYVKPGSEADLDSLIQDTIRLATSVKETCSESCEKSEQRWQWEETVFKVANKEV